MASIRQDYTQVRFRRVRKVRHVNWPKPRGGIAMPYFQIDHIKLRSILADAYLSLRQRRDNVIAAFAKLPDQLATDEDIELAQGIVRELNETREATRRDRLSDQKPFKEASAHGSGIFRRY